ncbi:hypothetical protein LWI29_011412 [Acer saccharum]|uniref:CCHC-type domain-containing protein n=1 Tax=Acer saccharum TaxID=4024 RepID=A0AA39W8C0_ACESA|nr:hypothetical protein LWI29_011412 [Acer saccharum]
MNSEDLELLCSALSLREKERPVGTLDNNLKVKGERVLSLCLVGKVLTTKVVNREAFINVMHSIWRTSDGVEIEALGRNVFGFHFKNSEDRKLIQSGGLWSFDRALIALEEPTGAGDVTLMKFNRVEIWVQIHNLPLICMTEDSGNFLGSMIGEVKEVDLLEAKRIGGRIIRVRVVIAANEPLMRSLRVDLLGTGEITTMLLRYERLQDYCFKCSRLGHSFNDCIEPGPGKEATTEAMARLNVWLRTDSPPKGVNYRQGSFERQNWGNKGGRPFSRADQGNWRVRAIWKGTGKKPSESHAGGRSGNFGIRTSPMGEPSQADVIRQDGQVGEMQVRQVGELQSLEPSKNSMRNDATINSLGGGKIAEIQFTVGEEQQIQAGKVVLQPLLTNQGNGLGPSGETGQVKEMLVDLPTATGPSGVDQINSLSPSTDQGPDTSLIASQSTPITTLKKTHNSVKWKRAARTKSGGSKLGEISSLGKRRPFELNEEIQLNAKRVKEGLLDEGDEGGFDLEKLPSLTVIGQMVTHPESVTSQEVLALVSGSLSADRSLPVRWVQ